MLSLDTLNDYDGPVLWDPSERPPDPMAWRVRQLMTHLNQRQSDALEEKYFLRRSTAQMAVDRGITERSVRGLLERARRNLVKAFAEHGEELINVPEEEW